MINLFREEVEDKYIRENFERLQNTMNEEPLNKGVFKFFSIELPDAGTFQFAHNLGYEPRDVIMTNVSSGVTVTWNYDSFDSTNLDITTDGATTIRAFVGRYEES